MNMKIFLYLLPAVVGSLGLLCSGVSNFFCETIKFVPSSSSSSTNETDITSNNTYSLKDMTTLYLGPWTVRDTVYQTVNVGGDEYYKPINTCIYYDKDTVSIDSQWKTVRAFSIIVLVVGGCLSFGLWFTPCMLGRISDHTWKRTAVLFSVLLTLFQGLCFLWIQDGSSACQPYTPFYGAVNNTDQDKMLEAAYTNECELASGSTAGIISVVLFFLTGVLMMMIGTPQAPPVTPPETQQVIYQQTINPDGTKTVQQVNVIKGTGVQQQSSPPPEEPTDMEAKLY